jgi:hypothetical protein
MKNEKEYIKKSKGKNEKTKKQRRLYLQKIQEGNQQKIK